MEGCIHCSCRWPYHLLPAGFALVVSGALVFKDVAPPTTDHYQDRDVKGRAYVLQDYSYLFVLETQRQRYTRSSGIRKDFSMLLLPAPTLYLTASNISSLLAFQFSVAN